jgi:hypothetical protein
MTPRGPARYDPLTVYVYVGSVDFYTLVYAGVKRYVIAFN